ncbi:MAG: DctP family TRAP transporter solute-binding subunit [Pseudomonadota bacterium]
MGLKNFQIRKYRLVGLSTALLALAAMQIPAAAAEVTLRLGWPTADSETDPYAIAAHYFAEELENEAPGEFDVRFFPSNELGNETEMLEGMQLGTLEAGVITATQIASISSAFQLIDLPFIFKDNEQARQVLDGEVGTMILDTLEPEGIVGLGFVEAGFRNTINNKRPVSTPDDMEGIRLRVQPFDIYLDSFEKFGADPIPMEWSEVFTAVQQGTIDGLEIPLSVIYANNFPDVTQYLSMTQHVYNAPALLLSKQTFDQLSDELKQAVQRAAETTIERQRETVGANNAEMVSRIEEAGMEVNEVEDVAAFQDLVRPVYEDYRETIGNEIMSKALEATGQE